MTIILKEKMEKKRNRMNFFFFCFSESCIIHDDFHLFLQKNQGKTKRIKASEEALQALNIIINKQVNMEKFVSLINDQTLMVHAHLYNEGKTGANSLTKKEFDLIEKIYYQFKDNEENN